MCAEARLRLKKCHWTAKVCLFQSWRTSSLVQSEIISAFTEKYVFVSVVTKWYNQLSAKAVTKSHHATEQLLTIQYIGSVKELSGGTTGNIITMIQILTHCFCELLRRRNNALSSRCCLFYNAVCAAMMHKPRSSLFGVSAETHKCDYDGKNEDMMYNNGLHLYIKT